MVKMCCIIIMDVKQKMNFLGGSRLVSLHERIVAEGYLGTIDNGVNMIKEWDPYYVRFAGIKISHVRRKWYEFALRNEHLWLRANPIEKQPDYGGKTPK